MRTFDYRFLPRQLSEGELGSLVMSIHEDKGRLDALRDGDADVLEEMRAQARFDNVDAALRIEGIYLDASRVKGLLEGEGPLTDTEAQVKGYAKALDQIDGEAEVSSATILSFYESVFSHRVLGRKSRYRKKDYLYVQVDGHPQAMPVSPITAFETPLVLGGACDALAEALANNVCSPLVLSAVFTVDFLAIRPFDEGNGRIARLFAEFLLERSGFDVFRYASIDRLIEQSGMDYYNALNECVEGWDKRRNDYVPYVRYWLEVVHAAYGRLFEEVRLRGAMGGKAERVRAFVRDAARPVTKRQLRTAFPDVSEATIESTLGKMVKEGAAEKLGAGRATSYRWVR